MKSLTAHNSVQGNILQIFIADLKSSGSKVPMAKFMEKVQLASSCTSLVSVRFVLAQPILYTKKKMSSQVSIMVYNL